MFGGKSSGKRKLSLGQRSGRRGIPHEAVFSPGSQPIKIILVLNFPERC